MSKLIFGVGDNDVSFKVRINNKTIKEFENKLGVNNGSWFVYDISVLNQDELHFSAIVVDPNKSMTYKSSKDRGEIWKDLIDEKEPNYKNSNSSFIL